MLPGTPSLWIDAPQDGVSLALYRAAEPARHPAQPHRGIALLVHGLGEHAGRYHETASVFRGWGYQVWAVDQRGHGQSAGVRGGLPAPDALLRDLSAVIARVREEEGVDDGAQPLTLLGHSMGGAVCARLVAEGADSGAGSQVHRLILSSPALALGLSPWMVSVVGVARRLVPGLPLSNGLKIQGISRDPEVVRAYRNDPRVHTRITPALAGFLLDTEHGMSSWAPQWEVPTLVLWSGADRLVDPSGSATFVRTAPESVVEGRCFPLLYHEILNEPERATVFEAMARWLGVASSEQAVGDPRGDPRS